MEEILEKLEKDIEAIKKQQDEIKIIEERGGSLKEELNSLQTERDAIADKDSGFYKDLQQQINEKDTEFRQVNTERMNKNDELNNLLSKKKNKILEELEAKKKFVDENRDVNLEKNDLQALRKEKEELERTLKLNDIKKEDIMKMPDAEKKEVRTAKEKYLINKHRLEEINPIIELMEILDGKTPKDRYIELSSMIKTIDKEFNLSNLDEFSKRIKEQRTTKETKNKEKESGVEKIPEEDIEVVGMNETEEKDLPGADELASNVKNIISKEKDLPRTDETVEQENETIPEEQPKNDIPFKITYNAKYDAYTFENLESKEIRIFKRENVSKEDRDLLKEKLGISADSRLSKADISLLNILRNVDEANNTDKMQQYFNIMIQKGKTKDEMQEMMREANIELSYNLKGLNNYKRISKEMKEEAFSLMERMEILSNANRAKELGIADVKKGLKVSIMEKIDKVISKRISNRMLESPEDKQRKNKEYSELTNGEYLKSIEKDYEKAKQIQKTKKIKKTPRYFTGKFKDKTHKMNKLVKNKMADKAESFAARLRVDKKTQQKLNKVSENAKGAKEGQENDIEIADLNEDKETEI